MLQPSKVRIYHGWIAKSLITRVLAGFSDHIDIMTSLAKPRKITIKGSNGQTYVFLGKPKDDLRKDARLMDFNSIINKLLKANVESRRRQLSESISWPFSDLSFLTTCLTGIRTYGVVTLNEECGFIQWVPNTVPMRHILTKGYENKRVKSWVRLLPFASWLVFLFLILLYRAQ